jgi:lipopolysaccharide transport system ATP-binding protein
MFASVSQAIKAPIRNFRRLRSLDTSLGGEGEDTLWALRDVSFEVQRGDVLGIIGRNGAGKSTLLKILSRITTPTSGEIRMRGRVSSLLEVGTGFHPELTGRENIFMNGTILGMRKFEIDRKFDEIVEFSGVSRFLDTPIKRYSSGQKVRLAFSVAAHLEPEILIVDEVLAVGDAEFQRKCIGRMKDVAKGGERTVLFVSHNMPAVRALCSRAMLLRSGVIEFTGDPHEVTQAYLDGQRAESGSRSGVTTISGKFIRRLEVLDKSGEPSPVVIMGEPCSFRITVQCDPAVCHPIFAIAISDEEGRRLLTHMSRIVNFEPESISGTKHISCHIPRVRLAPGQYLIKVAFGTRTAPEQDSFDAIASFEVAASDYFGTGRIPNSSQGIFVDEARWELSDMTESHFATS